MVYDNVVIYQSTSKAVTRKEVEFVKLRCSQLYGFFNYSLLVILDKFHQDVQNFFEDDELWFCHLNLLIHQTFMLLPYRIWKFFCTTIFAADDTQQICATFIWETSGNVYIGIAKWIHFRCQINQQVGQTSLSNRMECICYCSWLKNGGHLSIQVWWFLSIQGPDLWS